MYLFLWSNYIGYDKINVYERSYSVTVKDQQIVEYCIHMSLTVLYIHTQGSASVV
jgi:hypothetical protein